MQYIKQKFLNNINTYCVWCIIKPFEIITFGNRIFTYKCHHEISQNIYKYKISRTLILINIFMLFYSVILLKYFVNILFSDSPKQVKDFNLYVCYFMVAILQIAFICLTTTKSLTRLKGINSVRNILEKSSSFVIGSILSKKDVIQLKIVCLVFSFMLVSNQIIVYAVYFLEYVIRGKSPHGMRLLFNLTNFCYFQTEFQNFFTLIFGTKILKKYAVHNKTILKSRIDNCFCKNYMKRNCPGFKYNLSKHIPKFIRLHSAILISLKLFMDSLSLILPIGFCLLIVIFVCAWSTAIQEIITSKLSLSADSIEKYLMLIYIIFAILVLYPLLKLTDLMAKPVS